MNAGQNNSNNINEKNQNITINNLCQSARTDARLASTILKTSYRFLSSRASVFATATNISVYIWFNKLRKFTLSYTYNMVSKNKFLGQNNKSY